MNKNNPPRYTFIALATLLALAIAGFGRMGWFARSGSEEFATSLHSLDTATLGLVLDRRTPAEALPQQQLEFWSGELERILQQHPDDAELHAAAAVILDQPSLVYLSQLMSETLAKGATNTWTTNSNIQDLMKNSRASYDVEGARQLAPCARRATELEPDDVRWWRIRAALLWPTSLSSQYDQAREPEWKDTLAQARRYDPENALYDMIELTQIDSDSYQFEAGDMVVGDLEAWRRCIELAKRIGDASHLTLGEPAMPGLVRLHELSNHPTATTLESIRHHMLGQRGAMAATRSARHLLHMSAVTGELPDEITRVELIDLAIAVVDLAANRSDPTIRYDNLTAQMKQTVWQVRERLEMETGEVSAETKQEIEVATQSLTDFVAAATKWKAAESSSVSPLYPAASAISLSLFGVGVVCSLLWCVLWLAATSGLMRQQRTGLQLHDLRMSWIALLLAVAALSISYFFWGVGPAKAVSETTQHWVFTVLSFLTVLAVLSGVAVRMQYRWQFSIRSLMILSAVVAVGLQAVFHWQLGWQWIGLPIRVHAGQPSLLGQLMQQNSAALDNWIPGSVWVGRSLAQWLGNEGARYAGMLCVILSLVSCLWQPNFRVSSGRLLATSLLITLVMLNVWVWTEPKIYKATRPQQQRLEQYIRSIDEYYEPFWETKRKPTTFTS